ncbi:hypothetical protein PpBr36_04236 [Pyricularia pennisetigena]|uniref:hypothetical protein n=1 Tax=Pyricularia pennisetigena TaxID=1578925 RepID=UPI001151D0D1|nr:hypothetical protein PpBr36_04236 [Pyricularia pennisetigena]TLS27434.1 hypothetical protein PpBr36_04236 [Pyricularia pennisetigena]
MRELVQEGRVDVHRRFEALGHGPRRVRHDHIGGAGSVAGRAVLHGAELSAVFGRHPFEVLIDVLGTYCLGAGLCDVVLLGLKARGLVCLGVVDIVHLTRHGRAGGSRGARPVAQRSRRLLLDADETAAVLDPLPLAVPREDAELVPGGRRLPRALRVRTHGDVDLCIDAFLNDKRPADGDVAEHVLVDALLPVLVLVLVLGIPAAAAAANVLPLCRPGHDGPLRRRLDRHAQVAGHRVHDHVLHDVAPDPRHVVGADDVAPGRLQVVGPVGQAAHHVVAREPAEQVLAPDPALVPVPRAVVPRVLGHVAEHLGRPRRGDGEVDGTHVEGPAVCEERRREGERGVDGVFVADQRGEVRGFLGEPVDGFEDLLGGAFQRRVRADLDQHVHVLPALCRGAHRRQGLGEQHRPREVLDPVRGVEDGQVAHPLALERRVKLDDVPTLLGLEVCSLGVQRPDCSPVPIRHQLHVVRVVCRLDPHPPVEELLLFRHGLQLLHGRHVARGRDAARAVDARDDHPPSRVGRHGLDHLRDLIRPGPDRQHAALEVRVCRLELQHRLASKVRDRRALAQRQSAGCVRGADLPARVPNHRVRTNPPIPQQIHQRQLNARAAGLAEVGVRDPRRPGVLLGQLLDEAEAGAEPGEAGVERLQRGAEHGVRRHQLAAHGVPLRALAGKHEADPRGPRRPDRVGRTRREAGGQGGAVGPHDGVLVRQQRPALAERVGHVGEHGALEGDGPPLDVEGDVGHLLGEGCFAAGRDYKEPLGLDVLGWRLVGLGLCCGFGGDGGSGSGSGSGSDSGRRGSGRRGSGRRGIVDHGSGSCISLWTLHFGFVAIHHLPEGCFLGFDPRRRSQHGMCVATSEAEAVDADVLLPPRPGHDLAGDLDTPLIERDLLVALSEVVVREYVAPLQHHGRLDQADDAAGALEVSHVGLDGSDQQGALGAPVLPEHFVQRLHLQRVADFCAGAVGLDVAAVAGVEPVVGVDLAHQGQLRLAAGHGDAVGAAVLVHARADHQGADVVAVAERMGQRLEDDDAGALAAPEAVGARVEGVRPPVARQQAVGRHGDEVVGHEVEVARGQHHQRRVAAAQALHGQVQGGQAGRAGRLDRVAGAAKVEKVRHAVRHHGRRVARALVHGLRLEVAEVVELVVGERPAREAAHVPARDAVHRDPRVLQRLVRALEDQPVLRVHGHRLPLRDLEEGRVEDRDVFAQEAAPDRVEAAQPVGVRVVVAFLAEAVRRDPAPSAAAEAAQLVEGFRVRHAAWQATGHADDGHGFILGSGWWWKLAVSCVLGGWNIDGGYLT